MNNYVSSQIQNIIIIAKTFQQSCKMAALRDDGTIDREEEKTQKKIEKATTRFIKELQAIK